MASSNGGWVLKRAGLRTIRQHWVDHFSTVQNEVRCAEFPIFVLDAFLPFLLHLFFVRCVLLLLEVQVRLRQIPDFHHPHKHPFSDMTAAFFYRDVNNMTEEVWIFLTTTL
jgi:hypothetical protein